MTIRTTFIVGALCAAGLAGASAAWADCIDPTITPSFEERRLVNRLPGTDVSTPQRLMEASGFDKFEPGLIAKLCAEDAPSNFSSAMAVAGGEARRLWRAAVDRAQGKHVEGDLPAGDDRPLYWARLAMTRALRQWQPSFDLTPEQRAELIWEFERTSRGQYDIDFPGGPRIKRVLVSGFDPFSLGNPGSTTSTGIRIGNPSGANALSLDGQRIRLADGTMIAVETYVLPVNYTEFDKGMVEDTVAPHMQPGPKRVDVSISVSQGGNFEFWLEQWNGRFHGPSAGNDGIATCPAGAQRLPTHPGCNVYPPERWLGYDPFPWVQHSPPQFTAMTLPGKSMIEAKTYENLPKPPGLPAGNDGFPVIWHTNYSYFPNCNATPTASRNNPPPAQFPPPTLPIPPGSQECARTGGGGDYLSNEVAYRNTLMRDTFGLSIPAGHIHVPVMTRFGTNPDGPFNNNQNPTAITDSTFEAYRDAIVEQTRRLIFVAAQNLNEGAPPVGIPPN